MQDGYEYTAEAEAGLPHPARRHECPRPFTVWVRMEWAPIQRPDRGTILVEEID